MKALRTVDTAPTPGRSGGLRPIAGCDLDAALAVLARGFPERGRAFWERGLARVARASSEPGPPGYLLRADGADVGVLLTLRSERTQPDGTRAAMVNLCGWYVDPAHRWRAPMMLRRVVSEPGAVFTDLTPSPALERINPALGFEAWNEGEMLSPVLPWAALARRGRAEVHAFAAAGRLLGPEERDLLDRHAAMGCLPAVLLTQEPSAPEPGSSDRAAPLLFRIVLRRGVRVARLIYADSRRGAIRHRAALAGFLAGHGVRVLSIDTDRAECPPGAWFRPGRRRFRKGRIARDRLDYAESELVLLDLDM